AASERGSASSAMTRSSPFARRASWRSSSDLACLASRPISSSSRSSCATSSTRDERSRSMSPCGSPGAIDPPVEVSAAWLIEPILEPILASVFGDPDPALLHGIYHGLGAVIHRELAQDRAHVVLDGLFA